MDTAASPPPQLRADYRKLAALYQDRRTPDRLLAHYLVERRLADSFRASTRQERENGAYNQLYDTLLREVHDHPRRAATHVPTDDYIKRQVRMLLRELRRDDVFVDIGGGDCRVALAVASHVTKSIVVDVTDELVPTVAEAPNFQFVLTKSADVPLPDASVSFIYSNQVIEHIHPDDVGERMEELYRVLKPGGRYLCRTPNKLSGPHDVSMYFDAVARGTHMCEYTYASLARTMREAGFVKPRLIIAPRAYRMFEIPFALSRPIEAVFTGVPPSMHTGICRSPIGRALLGITLMVEKPL